MKKAAIYFILGCFAAITLIPFAWLLCASVKKEDVFFQNQFLPLGHGFLGVDWHSLTLSYYHDLLTREEFDFARSVMNSIFYASTTACLSTLCCAMGGYALAKFNFRGREALLTLVLGCLIIPGPC